MKKRSPAAVFFLGLFTLGFYSWYWAVKTKGEMNKSGAPHIPTAWIWLIPIVGSIWWYWKYSEGVEHVTKNKVSAVLSFILLYLLSIIGQAIIQNYFNKLEPGSEAVATSAPADQPQPAPVASAPAQPVAQSAEQTNASSQTPPTNLVQ